MALGQHAWQVIELLLKFGADTSGQHDGRQHLLEAILQNRMWVAQLLLRSGASARGVRLSKYLQSAEKKLGMLNRTHLLNHLPCFTWWGQDLPVEQLLKIRHSDLEAQLPGSGGAAALRLRTQIQVLEALQILVPLLLEDERLDVLASCSCLLRHLQCHPEATHLSAKQPASLIQFKDFRAGLELEEATDSVLSMAFSDKWLASGSEDKKVRIYNLEDFSLVKELEDSTGFVTSVALSDKWLASGSDDKKVRIYNLEDFSLVKELGDATGFVTSVALRDKWLASGSEDKKVRIYNNLEDFCLVKELEDATGCVTSVAFSDKWLASGSGDKKVRIYNLEDFRLVKELGEASDCGYSVAFSDKWLASGSEDNMVRIYDFQDHSGKELELLRTCFVPIAMSDQSVSCRRKHMQVQSYDSAESLLETLAAVVRSRSNHHEADKFLQKFAIGLADSSGRVLSLALSDKWLASGSEDKNVRIYNLEDFSLVKELGDATGSVYSVAFSDKWLASGSEDKKVRIYNNLEDFCLVKELGDATDFVLSVVLSDKWLASGSGDKKVRIYNNLKDFSLVKELGDATGSVYSVAFSDKWLASGSEDKKVRIYNLEDFSLVKELGEATDGVYPVAFSDKWLGSGSVDKKVRIYNLEDFRLVKELAEAGRIYSVVFRDNLLATSSGNQVVIHDIGKIKAFSAMHQMEFAPPEGGGLPVS